MRILYHHRTQAEDAQGIHIDAMVKAFRDLGHEVHIVALVERDAETRKSTRGASWKWIARCVPNWIYELMALSYNLYGYHRLCRAIKSKRPDAIYERYSLNTFCGIWTGRRFGVPVILEVNAPLYYQLKKLGKLTFCRFARFSERWICSNSSRTIVVSDVMKSLLMREGVPEHKIVVMHNGIDSEKFNQVISGEEVRRRYGLEKQVVVGFVGWFRAWHLVEMLIEAMHQANLSGHGVMLLLVGDGPSYKDLYRQAKQRGVLPGIVFTGSVKQGEIPAHIAAMDIAVQPGATEYACPIKLLEYMGMAKCVVAPDQPNIREILEDGKNGYLFRPGDQTHFTEVLVRAIRSPVHRRSVGQKALETVYERGYLWAANAIRALSLVYVDSATRETVVPLRVGSKSDTSGKSFLPRF